MARTVSIGNQGFEGIRKNNYFYIDKTRFIKDWWESGDEVTLITRPRRFGKTLNMNMLECFFSNRYAGRAELFEGLDIWNEEKYRAVQGTYPVIALSFAAVKADNLKDAKLQIKEQIARVYEENRQLVNSEVLSENEKRLFESVTMYMGDAEASMALNSLCSYMGRFYGKKVILLLDEYDTPMQEAYVNGYWQEFAAFVRSLFNSTFKTNVYLERAVMTGITRVSKESIFSDLNNLRVVTTSSDMYEDSFGFTEQEVREALAEYDMIGRFDDVKRWYDGFTFGAHRDIYNPWSITYFLKERQLRPYWASTSSNGLVNKLIRTGSPAVKETMERLINGEDVEVSFDEQIVFDQLDQFESSIWSLLLACGYLKIDKIEHRGLTLEPWYYLSITNLETMSMFMNMFKGWFGNVQSKYNGFVTALLNGNVDEMNIYMNEVALATFGTFDTGKHPSGKSEPERFYHGFVLGLLVEIGDSYRILSNRESGYGRYDVMLIPNDKRQAGIIMEFKVRNPVKEKNLQETVDAALKQIIDKKYDTELTSQGILPDKIKHYGFAFEGKTVLIGE